MDETHFHSWSFRSTAFIDITQTENHRQQQWLNCKAEGLEQKEMLFNQVHIQFLK